jgi:hypothetical protein
MILKTEKGQPVWNVGYPENIEFWNVPPLAAYFLCLFKEHIIDDNRNFDNLKCQHGNFVFSHDYHLLSRGKPTTNCPFRRRLYQFIFML